MWLNAVSPPGAANRSWRCRYCGAAGTWEELAEKPCTHVYPPCKTCGQTPECAADCPAVLEALGRPDVHVAGMIDPKAEKN